MHLISILRRLRHITHKSPSYLFSIPSHPLSFSNASQTQFQIHTNSTRASSDVYSSNLKLAGLCRRQDLDGARKLFDEMPQRDVVSYTTMINLCLKNGDLPHAERLFLEMPERNVVVESAMIDGYAKAGEIDKARRLFDEMGVKNVFSWTSLLSGYCRIGRIGEACRIFDAMPEKNVVSWTTMVLGYARNGLVEKARELFDQMPEKNVVSWTAMIKAYVESERIDKACELFDVMPHRNVYTWNIMILGYLECKKVNEALELFCLMPQRNEISWTTMVTGLAKNGCIDKAQEFFDRMPRKDIAAWNAMIAVYADDGLVVEARKLFDLMPERNIVTWNNMIDGYVKSGHQEDASRLFLLMLRSPVKRNEATLTSILLACESNVEVMQIHALARLLGFYVDKSFTNALVSMYSRCGDLHSAQLAFEELNVKDVVSWTSMILAYSNHGCGGHALEVFTQMLKSGVKPDGITFVGVLSACGHAGLVEKGRMIFNSMSQGYGIEPKAEHYTCLVDLLGRAGLIKEAKMAVSHIPVSEQDETVLGALLGACRVHNEIEVASQVGMELIELDPSHSGSYVLLANVYASSRKWNEVARVRKMMKERNVKKMPGFSQIEVKMRNHVFYVCDKSHPHAKEIYEMLEEGLLPQMREMGNLQRIQALNI